MKCRDFKERILIQSGDEFGKERLLKHAGGCPACAAFYETEKSLLNAIRLVIEDTAGESVSPQIEERLLAAFNSQVALKNAGGREPRPERFSFLPKIGLAFAAGLVVILVLITSVRQSGVNSDLQKEDVLQASINTMPTDSATALLIRPVPGETTPAPERKDFRKRKPLNKTHITTAPKAQILVKKAPRLEEGDDKRFFPLDDENGLVSLESGQLVRVEVPVSSLIKLGIPFKPERGNQSVQAELLIGQDGVARAIRPLE